MSLGFVSLSPEAYLHPFSVFLFVEGSTTANMIMMQTSLQKLTLRVNRFMLQKWLTRDQMCWIRLGDNDKEGMIFLLPGLWQKYWDLQEIRQ